MASSPIIVLLLFLYCLAAPGFGSKCWESACAAGEPAIRFPFHLRNIQEEKCGYTGFDLSCNNQSRTILTLPFSGDFLVHTVNYEKEFVVLQDPFDCLARRFLAGFNTSGSRFISKHHQDFTFFKCSSSILIPIQHFELVPCLSTIDYNIFIIPSDRLLPPDLQDLSFSCSDNWTVTIPVPLEPSSTLEPLSMSTLTQSISLRWDGTPLCKYCKEHGLSGGAKMGITLGVASTCFISIVGIFCYLSSKTRGRPNGETTPPFRATDRRTQLGGRGMDRLAIELYPKAEVGDSWQLPRPSNTTCSICLSEYQSEETLRMIPQCNHYFHARCIDPWLKQKGSCPLCRNHQG